MIVLKSCILTFKDKTFQIPVFHNKANTMVDFKSPGQAHSSGLAASVPANPSGLATSVRLINSCKVLHMTHYLHCKMYVDGTNFTKLNNMFMNLIKRPYLILSYSKSHIPTTISDSCSVKSEIKK